MKKVIKLTESDLARIVKRVLREQQSSATTTQGATSGNTTPGRVYQIADFTKFQPNQNINTVAKFAETYKNYVKSVGKTTDVWGQYDMDKKPASLCAVLNNPENVVTPFIKKDAPQDVQDFLSPPVKFICDKTNQNVMTALITKKDAQTIANLGGGGAVKKTYEKDANNLFKTFA